MEKVRRKITILRVLQVVFYALGFPLFVHMVMLAAKPISESTLATGLTGYMAIIIAAVLWVVVILVQLLFKLLCKKNRLARAVWVALFATVLTLAPIVYSDFMLKGKYDELAEKYIEMGVPESDLPNYEKMLTMYGEMIEYHDGNINEYVTVFNLDPEALEGKNFGGNGDGSEVVEDTEAQAFYSPNGMFSDGYLFSLKQAIAVQRAYYENKLAYEAEGKDIDAELVNAVLALEEDANSDWNKYKKGATASSFSKEGFAYITSSSEYEEAYGEDGYAKKFYITDDRLDAILSVLGANLGSSTALIGIIEALPTILPMLNVSLPAEAMTIIKDLPNTLKDLSVDKIIEIVNSLTIGDFSLAGTLAGLMGKPEGTTTITKDDLMGLLEGYSNYQSPSTYPIYYFIEDEALQEYAYAKYYATIHGGKVGSVLVGDSVGAITLDSSGSANPYTAEGLLTMFDSWDAQTELVANFYPIFAVRAIALKMSAAIVFCLLAAYWFTSKIDEQYAKLALARK